MAHKLPGLPYPYDALEPYIDAETMEIHYARHHGGYVDKLNQLLEPHRALSSMPLEDIITDIKVVPEEIRQGVRNNGGGHLNHSLFWQVMGPGSAAQPSGELRELIVSTFGDFSSFRDEFTRTAMNRFGSGWAWLALDPHQKLAILSTPNQDSPLMLGYCPILGLDVWEHAYYLKYHNRRADYVEAWWNVVNWEKVAELLELRVEATTPRR